MGLCQVKPYVKTSPPTTGILMQITGSKCPIEFGLTVETTGKNDGKMHIGYTVKDMDLRGVADIMSIRVDADAHSEPTVEGGKYNLNATGEIVSLAAGVLVPKLQLSGEVTRTEVKQDFHFVLRFPSFGVDFQHRLEASAGGGGSYKEEFFINGASVSKAEFVSYLGDLKDMDHAKPTPIPEPPSWPNLLARSLF